MIKYFICVCITICFGQILSAQNNNVPEFGAEVFIEPGQTPQEIDTWFKQLKESHMTVTRIRMFETYMHKADGSWDYTLFDLAFKAGEKYGIKIYANLFPATSFTDVGGFKFPRDQKHLESIAGYIKNVVTHFRQFKSCYGWVPINEPGSGKYPDEEFSKDKFNEWKKQQPISFYNSKGYEHLNFSSDRFLVDYNTWFLKWLTEEIRKYDPGSPVHVNNHAIFQNAAEYDFPAWRKFLTSLGASAHASWHFGYFSRDQYALAVSANSEIIRSGASNIPWIMTELQGGNNTYSGYAAMCPTKEEISQWVWTTIGTGSKGAIFWCLNPRLSGIEAGEWAMLDFQNEPSDRMQAAREVAEVIQENAPLFANATVVESGVNIVYIRESMWVETKLKASGEKYEGRDPGGVMKSALGYYEALSEMGLQANFKEINEFDFLKNDYSGISIILAHQIAIPSRYWNKLEDFVKKGGKLIVDGLTAYYDENAVCMMNTGFPLESLFGGNIREFKLIGQTFDEKIEDLTLPAHLWRGSIKTSTATPVGHSGDDIIATRNKYGKGAVLWMPSLIGLGSRINKDYTMLSQLLKKEFAAEIHANPFCFKTIQKGMFMKTLKSDQNYITIVINKSEDKRSVLLDIEEDFKLKPLPLYANKKGKISGNTIEIAPEETMVIQWKHD